MYRPPNKRATRRTERRLTQGLWLVRLDRNDGVLNQRRKKKKMFRLLPFFLASGRLLTHCWIDAQRIITALERYPVGWTSDQIRLCFFLVLVSPHLVLRLASGVVVRSSRGSST
jgi:hypothetical protein